MIPNYNEQFLLMDKFEQHLESLMIT